MHEDLLDLAKRAVAADGYYLIDGVMLRSEEHGEAFRVVETSDSGGLALVIDSSGDRFSGEGLEGLPPDFSDQLTCQAVPLMVRAKHGPMAHVRYDTVYGWVYVLIGGSHDRYESLGYDTELAAWVAALEAER